MTRSILIGGAMLAALSHPARADDPMPVTTDTVEYCLGLADQMVISELTPTVRALRRKGRLMCEQGHVLDGLMYVRHAMMMTRPAR